jgi:hypothetical protein
MTVPDAYALIDSAQTKVRRITPAMLAAAPTKETRDFLEKMYDNQQKEIETGQKEFGSTQADIACDLSEQAENYVLKRTR